MKCPKCDSEMDPVGMGDCNGWICPVCGEEKVDIASFKLNNEH